MHWTVIYIFIFATALTLVLLLISLYKIIAIKINMVDVPRRQMHKNHSKTIPLLGGAAMCSAWLLTIAIGLIIPMFFNELFQQIIQQYISGMIVSRYRILVMIIGALLITILGFCDDRKAMSAKVKFLGQLLICAFVVTCAKIHISLFLNSQILTWIITVFWMLLVINAINFFDNMDGLAAGIASIAFFFFMIISIIFKHYFIACLSAAGLGTTIGFWVFNYYPAKIFMGDCGSHFLGYILAITGAMTTYYQYGITQTVLAVLIPIFILAIPLFDLLSVVVIRIKANNRIYVGDNNHISHRFNNIGMDRKTAVLCVHVLAIIISLSVLPLLWGDLSTAIVCFIQACSILILVSIIQYSAKK